MVVGRDREGTPIAAQSPYSRRPPHPRLAVEAGLRTLSGG